MIAKAIHATPPNATSVPDISSNTTPSNSIAAIHARKNVAENVPRLSLFVIEASVSAKGAQLDLPIADCIRPQPEGEAKVAASGSLCQPPPRRTARTRRAILLTFLGSWRY
jgi:hypothetical protein